MGLKYILKKRKIKMVRCPYLLIVDIFCFYLKAHIHMAKYVPGRNIFCFMNGDKIRGERILEILGWAYMHH